MRVFICAAAFIYGGVSASSYAQSLKIGGSSSGTGSIEILFKEFQQTHPNAAYVLVPDLSSGGGIKAVIAGAIDIGVSSRSLKSAEQISVKAFEYGKTAFVLATSRSSAATGFTTDQLVSIYSGKLNAWPDGKRLRLVLSPPDDTDNELLSSLSPKMREAVTASQLRSGMIVEPTDHSHADALEKIPGSLGTSTLALITSEKRPLKVLSLNGIAPSPEAIENGSYPLQKTFYLVLKPQSSLLAQQFLDFVQSPSGQTRLRQLGYLPTKFGSK